MIFITSNINIKLAAEVGTKNDDGHVYVTCDTLGHVHPSTLHYDDILIPGLHLTVHIGKVLRGKRIFSWKTAHRQLRDS